MSLSSAQYLSNSASDSGSSQFEQIDAETLKRDIPEFERLSLAYRASMQARIGDVNDMKTLKQKNKVLKAAIHKEREIKETLEKKLSNATHSLAESRRVLDSKEEAIIMLEEQLQQLRDNLLLERTNSSKYFDLYQKAKNQIEMVSSCSREEDSFFSGLGTFIGLNSNSVSGNSIEAWSKAEVQKAQEQIVKVQEELQRNRITETRLTNELNVATILNESLLMQVSEMSLAMKAQQSILDEATQRAKRIQEEMNSLSSNYLIREGETDALKSENASLKVKFARLNSDLDASSRELEVKAKRAVQAEAALEIAKAETDNLQTHLDQIEDKIMMFTLKRQNGMHLDPIQMICRRDLEGQHIMEFDSIKERFALNVLDIMDVICELESDPVLTLNLSKSNHLIFKAPKNELRVIEKKIRKFVINAPCTKSGSRSMNGNQQREQKGFVGNIYSFFK